MLVLNLQFFGGRGSGATRNSSEYTNIDSKIARDGEVYRAIIKAQDFISKEYGRNIVDNTPIMVKEHRNVGERLYADGDTHSIQTTQSELRKGEIDDAIIVHEFGHILTFDTIYSDRKATSSVKGFNEATKAFIKEVSKDSGIKLTGNKIKELFGNYATKNGNEEFVSMTLQKGYERNFHTKSESDFNHTLNKERFKVYNSVVKLLKQRLGK